MAAKHFIVTGTVQGVFFRASTVEKARELGLRGRVKNMTDGSVTVHAEGDENELEALESWLNQGPPAASVSNVTSKTVESQGYDTFEKISGVHDE